MNRKNERNPEIQEEKDSVLRIAVTIAIALLIIGIIVVVVRLMNPRADVEKGQQVLKEMEQTDVASVEKKIQKLEQEEREADEAWANRSPNEKFANSLVLGDSITQGLYEYGVLDQSHVQADRGTEVCKNNGNKIDEHVAKAIELQPQTLFLAYGMNDIEGARGDADVFVNACKEVIDQLKKELPDTRIFINSIIPVQQSVIDNNELYAQIPQYNKKLQELCEDEKITFIDNSDLVKDEYYAEDGIHMSPEYYTQWVNRMAEVAGI